MATTTAQTLRDLHITQTLVSTTDGLWYTFLDATFTLNDPKAAKYIVTQRGPNDFFRVRQFEDMDVAVAAYNVAQQEAKDKEAQNLLKLILTNGYVPVDSVLHDRITSVLN